MALNEARSENYYQRFITGNHSENGASALIQVRSLAAEWGLILPANVQESGITFEYYGSEDRDEWFTGERWYYGQVNLADYLHVIRIGNEY